MDLKSKLGGKIFVIDPDVRRRAALSRIIFDAGIHAEPFESAAEFDRNRQEAKFILVHDDPGALAGVLMVAAKREQPLSIILYSECPDLARVVASAQSGAIDYLQWPFDGDLLWSRLSDDIDRRIAYTDMCADIARARAIAQSLSARQQEVLNLVSQGFSNKMMGYILDISPRTVEIHRLTMKDKLNLGSTAEIIKLATLAQLPVLPDLDFEEGRGD